MSDKTKLYQLESVAEAYVKYRPTYNSDVYETIVSFCQETGACDFSLAVDLGCGPGQSAVPLTKYFKRVIGLDISEAQVARAPKDIPNLSFRVGLAEDLSFLQDDSVDLVTVATAVHWMDLEKLYPEVERVLKPGGALVAYGYCLPTLGERKAQEIYEQELREASKSYWPNEANSLASSPYIDFSLPFPGWRSNDALKPIERSCTVDEFIGFMQSTTGCHSHASANPNVNVLDTARQRLKEMNPDGGTLEEERRLAVTWPVFMMMGHKPQA